MNALFLLAMAGWFSHRNKRVFCNLLADSFRKSVCLLDANRVALQQASNTYLAKYMCLPVRHSIISDHSILQRRMVNGRLCLRWMSAKLPDDSSPMSPCRPSSRDHENDEYLFIEFSFWENIRTVPLHWATCTTIDQSHARMPTDALACTSWVLLSPQLGTGSVQG